jgi:sporulation protein YlmC with PRC-barrel domain
VTGPRRASAGDGSGRPSRLLVAQLVGRHVETSAGERIGRVVDLELVVDVGGVRVAALELGTSGLFDRLHVTRPLTQRAKAGQEPKLVRWEDVERLDRRRVIVRKAPRR